MEVQSNVWAHDQYCLGDKPKKERKCPTSNQHHKITVPDLGFGLEGAGPPPCKYT